MVVLNQTSFSSFIEKVFYALLGLYPSSTPGPS